MPWLSALRPLRAVPSPACSSARTATRSAARYQGLKYEPDLMLVGYADIQARWYYRLKREYRAARAENRPFDNPVEKRTLRWRS